MKPLVFPLHSYGAEEVLSLLTASTRGGDVVAVRVELQGPEFV